ncbi:sensor histidine kinase [Cohnella terricola]|uniref:histidine kinase n=1 Tax=Cohnella terricola TaxID=1289167 RepID=A0A559JMX5_9BACL|nr:HAMP domain-containing sensor histidine kinase [Cohnella terricola]TVY01234.1 HAMP domain-containing histidine kinase [Cohnella terricola]
MSIRVRLVLSYVAMLVVPFLLTVVVVAAVSHWGGLRDAPISKAMDRGEQMYSEIKQMGLREPEVFLRDVFVEDLSLRLGEMGMGLIVRVGGEILYAPPGLDRDQANRKLPEFASFHEFKGDFYGNRWIVVQEDFLLADRRELSVFVVSDENPIPEYWQNYLIGMVGAFLLILALTNGVLTYLVSRSIIRPLQTLQKATEEIKEGNLDHEVKPRSKDEIGKLSVAFEEMRKKLKESVEVQLQYEENRKELVSNISHDLKTPVTAIKGYVEGIMDGVTNSPEKLDRYVKTIYAKATDMDRMIDELFLISKLDMGKLPFDFERVDIGGYLLDCARELQVDMEKKGIKLELAALPEEPVFVKADREKLKRVLINILENAMKYMDKTDGFIGMQVVRQDGDVVIGIADNGQGIAEEELPHVFDRFYRADPSRNSSTGGSGLGLSIAKQIVEEHGGRIRAESEYGKGTTIYVALPEWGKGKREETRA